MSYVASDFKAFLNHGSVTADVNQRTEDTNLMATTRTETTHEPSSPMASVMGAITWQKYSGSVFICLGVSCLQLTHSSCVF